MLSVGQELWFVPRERRRGESYAVTITKVGRKWAEISERGYRIDITTLSVDGAGFQSPGQCYLSQDEYLANEHRNDCWNALRKYVDAAWGVPKGLTLEQIEAAATALGVALPEPKMSD